MTTEMTTEMTIDPTTGEISTAAAPRADVAPEGTADQVQASLHAWAGALADAGYLARSLAPTSYVPEHLRGKPADVAVTILKGAALGLDPIAAMDAIYVARGRPALYSRAMHAVVVQAGHEVWIEDASDDSVTVCGRRRGTDRIQTATWDLERARRAGYLTNRKYAQEPRSMLRARAIAEVCRLIAPDALMGLSHSVEELDDVTGDSEETVTVTRAPRRRVRKAKPEPVKVEAAAAVAPTLDDTDPEPEGEPA